jgi:hypothetical protein
MTAIGSVSSLALDQVRATAATAKVPLVVQRAPTPPGANQHQIEAGRRAVEAARAEAAAAVQKVAADREAARGRGVVV